MPTISYASFLMYSTDGKSYQKLFPIKTTPDLLAPKEAVEVTTLEDSGRTYIPGIRQTDGSLSFTANYELEYAQKIEGFAEADMYWSVWLGGEEQADGTSNPTGEFGKYNFKGRASYSVSAMSVNGVREMSVDIMPSQAMYRDKTGDTLTPGGGGN